MRKHILAITILALMIPVMMMAQDNYAALWKQVSKAETDDLPQTERQHLKKIIVKAEQEKCYGQLLKALLEDAKVAGAISPDSLKSSFERMEQRAENCKETALEAVYDAVLYKVCINIGRDFDDDGKKAEGYRAQAVANPAALAAVKTDGYVPLVVKGSQSKSFYDDDLLSLIGQETGQWDVLHQYYMTTSNRRAQLYTAMMQLRTAPYSAKYIHRLDSLIAEYGDLLECGEVAIERYLAMTTDEFTTHQRLDYIDQALQRWGSWPRMNTLRNMRKQITQPIFNATMESVVGMTGQQLKIMTDVRHSISQVNLKIYKVKADGTIDVSYELWDNGYKKVKPLLTEMAGRNVVRKFQNLAEYEEVKDTFELDALPKGVYMLEFTTVPATQTVRHLYFVSDVRLMCQAMPLGKMRFVVVDPRTGKPLAGAKIKVKESRQGKTHDLVTDKDGEAMSDTDMFREAYVTSGDDVYCPPTRGYNRFYYDFRSEVRHSVSIHTDRAIYRPGQTVQVAAVCYSSANGFEHEVEANKQVTATLRDANYKVVSEQHLTTDDYGTVATQFSLPTQGLTGSYSIAIDGTHRYIRVEEYKRPTFRVEIPEVTSNYKAGDTLTVKATASSYAGVPVQDGKVTYRVTRRRAWWWMTFCRYVYNYYDENDDVQLFSGETTTGDDGTFDLSIPLTMPESATPQFYNFVVEADVTDAAGESHSAQMSVPLGMRKTVLTVDMLGGNKAVETPKLTFHLLNASGNDIDATIDWQLQRKEANGEWKNVGGKRTAKTQEMVTVSKLKSGHYRLKATAQGADSDELQWEFTVFSLDDRRPAVETDDWFYCTHNQFPNDDTPVTVQVGSSAKDVYMVYSIVSGNKVIEQGHTKLSGELLNRKFEYKEEYGNGIVLSFAWTKNGKTYTHVQSVRRPLADKKLTLQWTTFRDRLVPGQQETWTLKIARRDGKPMEQAAQLMATLYDKSLDQIVSHSWTMEPVVSLPLPSFNWTYGRWGGVNVSSAKSLKMLEEKELDFSKFDDSCFPQRFLMYRRNMRLRGVSPMASYEGQALSKTADMAEGKIGSLSVENFTARDVSFTKQIAANDETVEEKAEAEESDNGGGQEYQVRENLNETAFFYPQLMTDSTGSVTLSFTLPESLTTWRFLGVAHTTDMMTGSIEGEAVAKKDFMIMPNMPRFLRTGDRATISARVVNTTDHAVSATARLQLLDPETQAVVCDMQQPVNVEAGKTIGINFGLSEVAFAQSLLVCRMTVGNDEMSDGEQHYLPILPNTERVTVTVPFTQTAPGTKTIVVDIPQAPSNSAPAPKLTVEYTNNPAWLMIQALPTMAHPYDDCVVCQTASLYANTIGRHIINQNPQAKDVFAAWQREKGNETTLQSALAKNEELKDMILSETPWVGDADREAEQKLRIADFFDENTINMRRSSAIEKLQKLQNGDGSWSWWPGMEGSTFMTVAISNALVRLNAMAGEQTDIKEMLDKAFKRMDSDMQKLVSEMKRDEKKGIRQSFPSQTALEYLYLYAIDGRKPSAKVAEAQAYLKNLLRKDSRKQSLFVKAVSAIVLGNKQYVKSLKEYTVYREDMGRYYDSPRATYSWRNYAIPTQVAVIEALQRLAPTDTTTIDEMRRWLLQQKRAQAWDTPLNSIDAIYAFLNGNGQALKAQPKSVIAIDGKEISSSDATAGVGYVKTTVAKDYGQKVNVTIDKTSTGTSWGAVYAQFMQKTKDVEAQSAEISVKREFFKVDGKNRIPLAEAGSLKVGDRVMVRITINSKRDLDFVELQDRRAACMEPIQQLSGYRNGAYTTPKDNMTNYFFSMLRKGTHQVETIYFVDRVGTYETGTCVAQCAYATEFRATAPSLVMTVADH